MLMQNDERVCMPRNRAVEPETGRSDRESKNARFTDSPLLPNAGDDPKVKIPLYENPAVGSHLLGAILAKGSASTVWSFFFPQLQQRDHHRYRYTQKITTIAVREFNP
jgi:hypothetical protein